MAQTAAKQDPKGTDEAPPEVEEREEFRRKIHGVKINYVKHGHGPEYMLFLPDTLGSWSIDFGTILPRFDIEKYTVIAWDPPGYGKSRPYDREFDINTCKRDAELALTLMEDLHLTPFTAVGAAEGGRTALHMAADYPDSVKRLIVWQAMPYVSTEMNRFFSTVHNLEDWPPQDNSRFFEFYGKDYPCRVWRSFCDWITSVYEADPENANLCREILPQIKQPLLFFVNDWDYFRDGQEAIVEYVLDTVPNGEGVLHDEAEHYVQETDPDWFMEEVENFLEKHK